MRHTPKHTPIHRSSGLSQSRHRIALLLMVLLVGSVNAEQRIHNGMSTKIIRDDGTIDPGRNYLYTAPDRTAKGGIQGTIVYPSKPIEAVLAIPADAPTKVYQGRITGEDRRSFRFEGLPMRKYDLLVIYDSQFIEGFRLHREPDTLTREDREKITDIITKSEPFFKKKYIHRLEGTTGRGNEARAICTLVRDAPSAEGHTEHRRTFKLIMLKDVGPAWQIVDARDLYPVSYPPGGHLPRHSYSENLGGIRVTRSIKDLGQLKLTR